MQKKIQWLLVLLIAFSIMLSACQPAAPVVEEVIEEEAAVEEVEEVEEEAAEEVVEEEVVEEPEVAVATEEELDAAFSAFLGNMEAYQTFGLDALNEAMIDAPPFLLDVRGLDEIEGSGHIPGAIAVPLRELGENLQYLPADMGDDFVSYCGSGWRCTIAATALGALGWDAKCLKGGSFGGWVEAGYAVEEGVPAMPETTNDVMLDEGVAMVITDMLANIPEGWGGITAEDFNTALVETEGLAVLDVRTAGEVESKGYIEAADWTHVALESFIDEKANWPTDKDAPVVIYCGSGHRSTMAMTILWSYGYTDVTSLKGGYGGWADAGFPTAGGTVAALDTSYTTFLADMEGYNTIGLDSLNEVLVAEEDPFILDVRSVEEVEGSGYIPGAINIPVLELVENVSLLPAFDETIYSYCGSGWRCTIALTVLEGLGWEDVKCLKDGSFGGWVEAGYAVEEGYPEAVALDVADPADVLEAAMTNTLAAVPEGWGGITAEALNTALVENPDLILIDVRTAAEVAEGVIDAPNLITVSLEEFVSGKADWPADKDAAIVVYCGSGHRSTIAATMLWSYGYTDVLSLKGGFGGWKAAEFPIGMLAE
ncbi:MAG: hypothetical protein JEZ06_14080 [Anaerolineaceae bacterium]|nr:hypothetical protein [Anaerolineaceae bacterium]